MTADERFDALYDEYEHLVRSYCARRVDATVLDDAVADVFVVAWRKIADLPPDDEVLPWLYGVAYRVVCHEWRRAGRAERLRRRCSTSGIGPDPDPGEGTVERERRELVARAAGGLSETDREILRLTLWEELSLAGAAVVLGITPNAAKQRVYRARRHLVEEFRRLEGGPTLVGHRPFGGIERDHR